MIKNRKRTMSFIKEGVSVKIQESGEMYLETILILSQKLDFVRAVDICRYMDFSKPSVSRALGLLKNGGFITVADNGHIDLTETGRNLAEKIYERHTILTEVLSYLGVDEDIAAADACRIEHVISDETFDAIKNHLKEKSQNV